MREARRSFKKPQTSNHPQAIGQTGSAEHRLVLGNPEQQRLASLVLCSRCFWMLPGRIKRSRDRELDRCRKQGEKGRATGERMEAAEVQEHGVRSTRQQTRLSILSAALENGGVFS